MANLVALLLFFLLRRVYSQCSWQYAEDTLDLSCLKGRSITAEDIDDHTYTYTICADSAGSCQSGEPLMCRQVANSNTDLCFEIGRWNAEITPVYGPGDDGINGWQFEYNNGGSCGNFPRSWSPRFICDSGTELSYGSVDEIFGSCRYTLDIRTKYACPGGAVCDDSSSGLGGGWIFIIILISAAFLYFVVGYIVTAVTVNKESGFGDFNGNIPNRAFWCALPSLVIAGCSVTKDSISGLINKGKGEDADAPLTES